MKRKELLEKMRKETEDLDRTKWHESEIEDMLYLMRKGYKKSVIIKYKGEWAFAKKEDGGIEYRHECLSSKIEQESEAERDKKIKEYEKKHGVK